MKELGTPPIDPVTLSDNPRSNPTRNHWALLTQKLGEDSLLVDKVFGHGPAARKAVFYAMDGVARRHGAMRVSYTNLQEGNAYDHRTEQGVERIVHAHKTKAEGRGNDSDEAFNAYEQGLRQPEPELEKRITKHEISSQHTIYTRSYYDSEGRYRGAVPDPEGGAPYGWHVVNGQLKPVDPFE